MNEVQKRAAIRSAETGITLTIKELFSVGDGVITLLQLTESVPDFLNRDKVRDAGYDTIDALQNLLDSLPKLDADGDPLVTMLLGELESIVQERVDAWREQIAAAYEGREPNLPKEASEHKPMPCRNCGEMITVEVCRNCGTIHPPELWPDFRANGDTLIERLYRMERPGDRPKFEGPS